MKLHSLTPSRTALTVACGLAFAAGIVPNRAKADGWDKKTIITVNQPIQIRDTLLGPGSYVLKLYNSSSDRHVVQIFNADQSHIIDTVIAIPKQRMRIHGDTRFEFWETPAGTVRALRSWFYPGDTFGQEFPYPKHLQASGSMDAKVTTTTNTVETASNETKTETPMQQQTDTVATETTTAAATTAAATTDNSDRDRAMEEKPVEVAQAAPAPAPEPAPQTLPKTGSPFPLIGLCGGVLLSLYGLLRLKSWA